MDNIKIYIKHYIRTWSILLNPEEINILSAYGHHKLYYNNNFICYLDSDMELIKSGIIHTAPRFVEYINKYINTIQTKFVPCIYCITSTDEKIIQTTLINLIKSNISIKIIVIAPTIQHFEFASYHNLEYQVAPNDYRKMIQVGLNQIKTINSLHEKILIINSNTLINISLLKSTATRFNNLYNFAGSSSIKYIEQSNMSIHDLTFKTTTNKMFFTNWFFTDKKTMSRLNWQLFDDTNNIYDLISAAIKKINGNVLIADKKGTLCFGYDFHNLVNKIIAKDSFDRMEYSLLEYIKQNSNIATTALLNFMNKITVIDDLQFNIAKPKIQNNMKTIKPNIKNSDTALMLNSNNFFVDKIYIVFLNLVRKTELVQQITKYFANERLPYEVIDISTGSDYPGVNQNLLNGKRTMSFMKIIRDAMYNKYSKILILEDNILYNNLVNILKKSSVFPVVWDIILFSQAINGYGTKLLKMDVNNFGVVRSLGSFAMCIHNNIFRKFDELLTFSTAFVDCLIGIQRNGNTYVYYDNGVQSSFGIHRNIKVQQTLPQPPQNIPNLQLFAQNIEDTINKTRTEQTKTPVKPTSKPITNISTITAGTKLLDFHNSIPNQTNIKTSMVPIANHLLKFEQYDNNQNNVFKFEPYNKTISNTFKFEPYNDNKIIQSLWIGDPLSFNEILCIMSYIGNGHEFHLYVYGDVKNIPRECIIKNANEIIPESQIFYYSDKQAISGKKVVTGFSNTFRYKLLYDKGGIWTDMDMICLKPITFTEPFVFSSEYSPTQQAQVVNVGFIKCPQGSSVVKYCYDVCQKKDTTKIVWGEIGPRLFGESVKKYNLSAFVKPYQTFCPIGIADIQNIITPKMKINVEPTWFGIHLWNEIWRLKNFNKNKLHYGSFYHLLLKKYADKYIKNRKFNLRETRGSINKAAVMLYWFSYDAGDYDKMINVMKNESKYFSEPSYIDIDEVPLDKTIENTIGSNFYVELLKYLLRYDIVDELHIIYLQTANNKFMYGADQILNGGNYCRIADKIHLYKLANVYELMSFLGAKLYFYYGHGHYEMLYSLMAKYYSGSIFLRYIATSPPYVQDGSNIVVDKNWFTEYLGLAKLQSKIPNFDEFMANYYSKYDIVYIDSPSRIGDAKLLFPGTKYYVPIEKFSLMKYEDTTRIYDIVCCAADNHPSKNWPQFCQMIDYFERNKKKINILVITPTVTITNRIHKYDNLKFVNLVLKSKLSRTEVNEYFNLSKCNLVMFGRDAFPRVISESLSCGCYNLLLDTLSDGKHVIEGTNMGSIIEVKECDLLFVKNYSSITIKAQSYIFDKIYELANRTYDHKTIADKFNDIYGYEMVCNRFMKPIANLIDQKNKFVVTTATPDYTLSLNYLLSSVNKTNPGVIVLVYAVGWDIGLYRKFVYAYPRYFFERINMPVYDRGDILKLKVKLQYEACMKHKIRYIWIDADSVVVRSLDPLFAKLGDYNLLCYSRFDARDYHMKFAVGVIAFGFSKDNEVHKLNLDFVTDYFKTTERTQGKGNWFHDQIALYETYQSPKYIGKIKLYSLRDSEHSINGVLDTIVYSRRPDNRVSLLELLVKNNIDIVFIDFFGVPQKYHS